MTPPYAAGRPSSLQPANLRLKRAVANEAEALKHAIYPLLYDPQTSGGLLAAVPAAKAAKCLAALKAIGFGRAAAIGEVTVVLPEGTCVPTPVECRP